MLQKKVDGIEMGIAGWFGPGGWGRWLEESWEHKKRSVGDLGCNTGEMGTALRYTKSSKLFTKVLEPVTEELAKRGYVGDVSINCMIDKETGVPWPMEFTTRMGWPDFNIRVALHDDDPAEWMLDLIEGKDTLRARGECAVGVVLVHGKFPWDQPAEELAGFPIYGLTARNMKQLAFVYMKMGKAPMQVGIDMRSIETYVSAGNYLAVARGTGETFKTAADSAYRVVDHLEIPSNLDYRTDISDRLRRQLPLLQAFGYAKGVNFS
jgi:phosphoribosylamine---glycine ligase